MANLGGQPQLGHNLRIYMGATLLDAKPIAAADSCKLSWSTSFESISHKDIDPNTSIQKPTDYKFSLSTKLYMTTNPDTGRTSYFDVVDAGLNGTLLWVKFDDGVLGGVKFTGQAYVGKFDADSQNNKTPMFSCDFEGVGTLTALKNVA